MHSRAFAVGSLMFLRCLELLPVAGGAFEFYLSRVGFKKRFAVVVATTLFFCSGIGASAQIAPGKYNSVILDQIRGMPTGGQYSASRTATIRLQSAAHFESGIFSVVPDAASPSYCSGATYLVFIKTIEALRAHGAVSLNYATLESLLIRNQRDGGRREGERARGTRRAGRPGGSDGGWGRAYRGGPGVAHRGVRHLYRARRPQARVSAGRAGEHGAGPDGTGRGGRGALPDRTGGAGRRPAGGPRPLTRTVAARVDRPLVQPRDAEQPLLARHSHRPHAHAAFRPEAQIAGQRNPRASSTPNTAGESRSPAPPSTVQRAIIGTTDFGSRSTSAAWESATAAPLAGKMSATASTVPRRPPSRVTRRDTLPTKVTTIARYASRTSTRLPTRNSIATSWMRSRNARAHPICPHRVCWLRLSASSTVVASRTSATKHASLSPKHS